MTFDPRLAEIRFGTGLSPQIGPPRDIDDMLARLGGPDRMARALPIKTLTQQLPMIAEYRAQTRRRRKMADQRAAATDAIRALHRTARNNQQRDIAATLGRAALTDDGLRERLTQFWADHFTAKGKVTVMRTMGANYVEEAIRPNLGGSFATLLKAVVTNPMMLLYLDQAQSFGPDSPAAKGKRGLNENLARELMELHTLGVDGPYTQADVRQLARLLTGLSVNPKTGFVFRAKMAEPGAETVLGTRYGGGNATLADVYAVLDDLARHPATAHHIAHKLAVHFVADDPDPALVGQIEAAFTASGGDLMQCYRAMLSHPAAWAPRLQKARQPLDFIGASLRALAIPGPRLAALDAKQIARLFTRPMAAMGQPWENPIGPDGWAEQAAAWITPQGMAGRIQWAMKAPSALRRALPDPRVFVQAALGGAASNDLQFAAAAAENRAIGIGLVLVSPEFQRR